MGRHRRGRACPPSSIHVAPRCRAPCRRLRTAVSAAAREGVWYFRHPLGYACTSPLLDQAASATEVGRERAIGVTGRVFGALDLTPVLARGSRGASRVAPARARG